jgi:hypothetical protein
VLAYNGNWKSIHPFHYHAKDFKTPDGATVVGASQVQLDYSKLGTNQFLEAPEPILRKVDHRYSADYYATESVQAMLPDGSIVKRDGYGAEIRMGGGNIYLSAPGDIVFQSGRHIVAFGGDDVVIKARNSVDVTTSNHDVRIKAQRHMELMSGNSGTGRMLVECRASGVTNNVVNKQGEDVEQSGLIISAPQTDIALLAGFNAFISTNEGQIMLDAAAGGQAILSLSAEVVHYTSVLTMAFSGGNTTSTHIFGPNAVEIQGSILAKGPMTLTDGGLAVNGNVAAIDGAVGPINPSSNDYARVQSQLDTARQAFQQHQQSYQENFNTLIDQQWFADDKLGSQTVRKNTQFAPRTDKQMRSTTFVMPEAYFQQIAGSGLTIWNEQIITYQGRSMMPYPGHRRWKVDSAFLQADLKLRDVSTGLDAVRGEAYENVEGGKFKEVIADKEYKVLGD